MSAQTPRVPQPTAVILGVTADIGRETAHRFLRDGWRVIGLGRSRERLDAIAGNFGITTISCDLGDVASVRTAIAAVRDLAPQWDLFLSCAGTMEPIGPFFSASFDEWERSVTLNVTAQLRVLHGIWPARRADAIVDAILLAGGGTNGPFPNYSAYCVSKIALIKACELLDNEEAAINAFAIGPGFVRTRIHDETRRAGAAAGDILDKTNRFYETPGTSFDDIYAHVRWCMAAGREVAGGRNFSTVHDAWRGSGQSLREQLAHDANAFRLRRREPG
jgi:NAD(P)-dependent dehydrogenase (short-subunit alcohol dehydrogenase family)